MAEGSIGAQFAQFIELLEYSLHHWFQPNGGASTLALRNKSIEDADSDSLHAIYFDKLGNICARLWNAAYQEGRRLTENDTSIVGVRRPVPFQTRRGLYGPGLAVQDPDSGSVRYLIDTISSLQELTLKTRFEFKSKGSGNFASDKSTVVRPAVPHASPEIVINKFNEAETSVARDIAGLIGLLNSEEIRAFGTHYSVGETVRDLEFEVEEIVRSLGDESKPKRIVFAGSELVRKSLDNRAIYEAAYNRAKAELRDPGLTAAFDHVHANPAAIWDDLRVIKVQAEAVSTYGLACLYAGMEVPTGGDSEGSRQRAERTAGAVRSAKKLLKGRGGSKKEVKKLLTEKCNDLLSSIHGQPTHDK